jgi:O-antigen/teichoic acid export membrane protein
LKTTRNAIWLTACRLTGDVLNLLFFVFISRQFGPAGAGVYSYGFAVATFGFVIACLGIEEYGLRQYSRLSDAERPGFLAQLLGAQAYMVVVAVFALAVYLAITAPSQQTLVLVCALAYYQITAAIAPTLFIPAMAQQQMSGPAVAELTARTVAFTIAGCLISIRSAPLALAVVGFPVAAIIWLTLAVRSARQRIPALRLAASWSSVRGIVTVLWSFALLEIFAQLFARVGVISLSLGVSDAAAGVYATGLRLIEVGLMPLSFFGVASYPRLSQLFATNPPAFRRSAGDLLWLMVFGGAALAWGLYFVAPSLLVPVLGERFAGAEPVIQTMAVFALVQAVEVGLGRIMLCADKQAANAAFIACGAVVGVILNLLLVPRLGVNGAIYAGVAAFVAVDILCVRALKQPLGGGTLARILLSLGVAVGIGAAAAAVLAHKGTPIWLQAIVCALALVLVGGAGFRMRHRGAADVHWQEMTERR